MRIDSHQVCKLSVKMLTRIMISWNVVCSRAWHAFAFEHILHDLAKHSCFSQRVGSAINMVCRIAHYGMKKGSSKSSAKVQLLRAKSIIISLCQRSPTINQSSRDNKNSFHFILVRLFFSRSCMRYSSWSCVRTVRICVCACIVLYWSSDKQCSFSLSLSLVNQLLLSLSRSLFTCMENKSFFICRHLLCHIKLFCSKAFSVMWSFF